MRGNLSIEDDFELESIRLSKMGYQFDLHAMKWKLDNSLTINWELLKPLSLDPIFEEGFRKNLADFASEMSPGYTKIIFFYLKKLLKDTSSKNLSVGSVRNYLGSLDSENEWELGCIRAFLVDWSEKEFPGLTAEVAEFLREITLKGFRKGKAVLKGCPHEGPYSLQEQQSILEWSVNAFDQNVIDLEDYSWLMANMYLGHRPVQIRFLTLGDLIFNVAQSGEETYKLRRVEAKQQNAGLREVTEEIEIDEDLALLLYNQGNYSVGIVERHFQIKLSARVKSEIPLFLDMGNLESYQDIDTLFKDLTLRPDLIFMTLSQANKLMSEMSKKCQARTIRLEGEYILLRSRRFRYTVGTNARRRGLSAYHIAKILGHKDIQNVQVYVQNTHETVDLIDEVMTSVLAPLAQAFAGTLIDSEKNAIRANDPRSRIKSNDGSGVGSCGEFGFCASGGRQCYLCSKFQPWAHGHHQKVLDSVLSERESLRKRGASTYVIQSTDRLLLAVEQVVQLCNAANRSKR